LELPAYQLLLVAWFAACRAIEHDAETVEAQSRAVAASREALHLIQINYEAGRANYLDVLVGNTQYQQARLGYLQSKAQRLQDTVALFVALGGGWWNAPNPQRAEVRPVSTTPVTTRDRP
jgi:outer membrane protein TolC